MKFFDSVITSEKNADDVATL